MSYPVPKLQLVAQAAGAGRFKLGVRVARAPRHRA